MQHNWSANTDSQLQEAASPQGLRSGCLQRYAAMSRYLIVSLILSSSATIAANTQGIALSKIAECTCTAHSNQAICLKSKSDDPPCVMFYPDQFGQETEAIVNLQGRFVKIYRRPRSPEVNYSNWVFKSADGSVIVTLNASAVDDCSRSAD